jgi:hypothetical protein
MIGVTRCTTYLACVTHDINTPATNRMPLLTNEVDWYFLSLISAERILVVQKTTIWSLIRCNVPQE